MSFGGPDNLPCAFFQRGSFFGEIELLQNSLRQFSCVALTKCEVLCINKKDFQSLFFKRFPKIGEALTKLVCIKVEGMRSTMGRIHSLIKEGMLRKFPQARKSIQQGRFN